MSPPPAPAWDEDLDGQSFDDEDDLEQDDDLADDSSEESCLSEDESEGVREHLWPDPFDSGTEASCVTPTSEVWLAETTSKIPCLAQPPLEALSKELPNAAEWLTTVRGKLLGLSESPSLHGGPCEEACSPTGSIPRPWDQVGPESLMEDSDLEQIEADSDMLSVSSVPVRGNQVFLSQPVGLRNLDNGDNLELEEARPTAHSQYLVQLGNKMLMLPVLPLSTSSGEEQANDDLSESDAGDACLADFFATLEPIREDPKEAHEADALDRQRAAELHLCLAGELSLWMTRREGQRGRREVAHGRSFRRPYCWSPRPGRQQPEPWEVRRVLCWHSSPSQDRCAPSPSGVSSFGCESDARAVSAASPTDTAEADAEVSRNNKSRATRLSPKLRLALGEEQCPSLRSRDRESPDLRRGPSGFLFSSARTQRLQNWDEVSPAGRDAAHPLRGLRACTLDSAHGHHRTESPPYPTLAVCYGGYRADHGRSVSVPPCSVAPLTWGGSSAHPPPLLMPGRRPSALPPVPPGGRLPQIAKAGMMAFQPVAIADWADPRGLSAFSSWDDPTSSSRPGSDLSLRPLPLTTRRGGSVGAPRKLAPLHR